MNYSAASAGDPFGTQNDRMSATPGRLRFCSLQVFDISFSASLQAAFESNSAKLTSIPGWLLAAPIQIMTMSMYFMRESSRVVMDVWGRIIRGGPVLTSFLFALLGTAWSAPTVSEPVDGNGGFYEEKEEGWFWYEDPEELEAPVPTLIAATSSQADAASGPSPMSTLHLTPQDQYCTRTTRWPASPD